MVQPTVFGIEHPQATVGHKTTLTRVMNKGTATYNNKTAAHGQRQ